VKIEEKNGVRPHLKWGQTPFFLTPLFILLIAGCAMRPTVPGTSVAWAERREALVQMPDWQARGRIAVKSAGGGGQGSIRWRQAGSGSRVRLSGPFGVGAYEISWKADSVEIIGKAGEVEIAYAGQNAAERFLMDQLGWSFPAMSLRYWILGVPDPGFESNELFDTDGWLVGIQQGGWSIEYDEFEIRNAIWLPKRIVMRSDDARVRLIIDDWLL